MLGKHLSTIFSAFYIYSIWHKTHKTKQEMAWRWLGRRKWTLQGTQPQESSGFGSSLGLTLDELLNFCSPLFLHLENERPGPRHSSWNKVHDSSLANPPLPPNSSGGIHINNLYTPAGQLCIESSFPYFSASSWIKTPCPLPSNDTTQSL